MLCEYGCGQEGLFQFKNGKWCCSKSYNSCPSLRKKNSDSQHHKEKRIKPDLCDYGCGQKAIYKFKNGNWCCSKITGSCPKIRRRNSETNKIKHQTGENAGFYKKHHTIETRKLMSIQRTGKNNHTEEWLKELSEKMKGKNNPFFDQHHTKESRKTISLKRRFTIEQIQEQYPTFGKEEEMRYNPDKPMEEKEIQVHCKNSNCENSKEKGGWFTPSKSQIYERIRQTDSLSGQGGCYIYCSQHCKDTCPLYNLHGDPFKEQAFRSQVWNEQVLKQDNYTCQICGSKENLHCHHIRPVKLEPEYALDPDNGIVLCQICHIKYGHKVGTECSFRNLAKKKCKKKGEK